MIQIIDDINTIPFDDISNYDDIDDIGISLTPNLYLDTSNEEKWIFFKKNRWTWKGDKKIKRREEERKEEEKWKLNLGKKMKKILYVFAISYIPFLFYCFIDSCKRWWIRPFSCKTGLCSFYCRNSNLAFK